MQHVWKRLQDADTYANIGPVEKVWDPVHDDDGVLQQYTWSTTVGRKPYEGSARTVEAHNPSYLKMDLDAGEVAGSLATALEAVTDEVTNLAVTLEIISKGTLSTLFFPVISDAVGRGLPEQVETFAGAIDQD
jgi:hypothetical protein